MKTKDGGAEVVLRLAAKCDGEYFHIIGYFLLSQMEDGARRLENISERSAGFPYDFSDLQLSSQGNSRDEKDERALYAWRVGYRNKDVERTSHLVKMGKTIRRLEKGVAEQAKEMGPVRRFSEYVGRVCRVLGIKTVVVQAHNVGWSYSESEWRYMTVGEGVDWSFRKEEEWRETGTVKTVD